MECAAWPTVFWDECFCLTVERANHPQKKEVGRQSLEAFMAGGDNFFGAPDLQEGKHGIKRLFSVTNLNFATSKEILQFAYDLQVWTTVGARRNLNLSIPLRLMMSAVRTSAFSMW